MDGKKGGYLVVLVFRKREEVWGQAKWSCRCIMPWRLERRGHQSSLMYNGWRGRLVAMWYTLNLLRTLKIWLIEREREQQEVPVNGSSFLKDICQRKRSLDLRLSSLPICATAQWPPPYRSLHSFSSSIFKSLTPSFSPSIEALTTSSCWLIFSSSWSILKANERRRLNCSKSPRLFMWKQFECWITNRNYQCTAIRRRQRPGLIGWCPATATANCSWIPTDLQC